jgi:hypothetical protein
MGRPVTVALGPLASASATKISLSQKAAIAGTNYLVLNGAAGSFSANNVCQSQTPGGAGALTLNGSTVVSGVARLGSNQRIYITGGSDESGKTFAVVGTKLSPNGLISVTETITGPNASTVSSINQYYSIISITASAGTTGAITVGAYGTATLDIARQVLFTPAGNDSSITYTIAGTDVNGQPISEVVTGVNNPSTAVTALSYKTITSIATSGAVGSTITVGTNGVSHSQWVRFDDYAANAQVSLQCVVTGTVSYTVQVTMSDPNAYGDPTYGSPASVVWSDSADTAVVAATATKFSTFAIAPVFARVVLNSGTGTVSSTFKQAYLG